MIFLTRSKSGVRNIFQKRMVRYFRALRKGYAFRSYGDATLENRREVWCIKRVARMADNEHMRVRPAEAQAARERWCYYLRDLRSGQRPSPYLFHLEKKGAMAIRMQA